MVPAPTDRIGDCSLYLSPCLEVLRQLPENSLEACVTDPPSGTGFMGIGWDTFRGKSGVSRPQYRDGKGEWDYIGSKERARTADQVAKITKKQRDAFIPWLTEIMAEVYRALKPGAHALVWALPRTSHWTAMACEDAGFEVRDSVLHLFSSGFPKSQNIARAIDKTLGMESKIVGVVDPRSKYDGHTRHSEAINTHWREAEGREDTRDLSKSIVTEPVSDAAKQYQGYGSALSPSHETWWLCRKPLSEPTLAQNVLKWGVGGLNIDGCRIPGEEPHHNYGRTSSSKSFAGASDVPFNTPPQGRWPKNVVLTYPEDTYSIRADITIEQLRKIMDYFNENPKY